jgi:hypothetical protein
MQVSVRKDAKLLRDTVIWDVMQPYNTAEQYASGICECMSLRYQWYMAIVAAVNELLHDIKQVRIYRRSDMIGNDLTSDLVYMCVCYACKLCLCVSE